MSMQIVQWGLAALGFILSILFAIIAFFLKDKAKGQDAEFERLSKMIGELFNFQDEVRDDYLKKEDFKALDERNLTSHEKLWIEIRAFGERIAKLERNGG